MSYRTLEEKFLADYEKLESEASELRARVAELESQFEAKRGCLRLDTMVRKAGRKAVFESIIGGYNLRHPPQAGLYSYEAWCAELLDDASGKPNGVSDQELIDYFDEELVSAFERNEEQA